MDASMVHVGEIRTVNLSPSASGWIPLGREMKAFNLSGFLCWLHAEYVHIQAQLVRMVTYEENIPC